MKRKLLLIIIAAAVIFTGCKSLFTREGNLLSDAKQADKRGNYHAAVLSVVESVRIDNEYKKAIEFLIDIYPRANSYYALKIDEKRSGSEAFANDDIVRFYGYLKDINEAVRTLPPLINPKTKMGISFTYTDYTRELDAALELAAEDHYREGLRFQKLSGRENAKVAAMEFEKALSYVPGYKDAETRASQALEAGTQILAFLPFVNNAWNIPTAQFSDIMLNTAISELMNDPSVMKFTKIIDRNMQQQLIEEQLGSLNAMMNDESRVEIGQLLNSNILITGTIDSARLEGPETSMNQYHRTAEITVEETAEQSSGYYKNENSESLGYYKDSETDPYYKDADSDSSSAEETVYGTREIEADIFIYRKSIEFEVTVSYRAIDVETGTILKSDTLNILTEDSSEWAEWSGNEDALTWEDKLLIDTYEESVLSAQQLASESAEEVGIDMALGLASFLK